jgi:plastocyanin
VTIGTDAGTDVRFIPAVASVRTGAAVSLMFQNHATVAHNLTFGPPIDVATATLVEPGTSETIMFDAPEPGAYEFVCTLHPGMAGTVTVTPQATDALP